MNIRTKIALNLSIIGVLVGILTTCIFIENNKSIKSLEVVEKEEFTILSTINRVYMDTIQIKQLITDGALTGEDPEISNDTFEKANIHKESLENGLKSLSNHSLPDVTKKKIEKLAASVDDYYQQGIIMTKAYNSKNEAKSNMEKAKFESMSRSIMNVMQVVRSNQEASFEEKLKGVKEDLKYLENLTIILFIAILIIGGTLSIVMSKSIRRPINDLINLTKKMSDGDYSERINIKASGEVKILASHFEELRLSLNNLITKINTTSDEVYDRGQVLIQSSSQTKYASEEISRAMEELASTSISQMDNTSTVMNAVEENNQYINQGVEKIEKALDLSTQSSEYANQGKKEIDGTISELTIFKSKIENVSASMNQLEESFNQINKIVKMIEEISNQTNLLSLNASIEAARAGEQGKGFSVVATEVRKLAEDTRHSAQNVNQLVVEISTKMREVSGSINESLFTFTEQLKTIQSGSDIFKGIVSSTNDSTNIVNEINDLLIEISKQSSSITQSMQTIANDVHTVASTNEEISASTQENLAMTENVSSEAGKLNDLATTLKEQTSVFKLELETEFIELKDKELDNEASNESI